MLDKGRTEGELDLASAFAMVSHDIKNSLGILLKDISMVSERFDAELCGMKEQWGEMEYEVRRINNNLVKMLTLYKVEEGGYLLNLDAYPVHDFLHEALLEQVVLLQRKSIACDIQCDGSIYWYFDRNLLLGVMRNALSNALRYTGDRIRISADASGEGLSLTIEDNGSGFPDKMLERQGEFIRGESGFLDNNTGLGIFFTQKVLDLHRHDGREGWVRLSNGGELGGGRFSILLP